MPNTLQLYINSPTMNIYSPVKHYYIIKYIDKVFDFNNLYKIFCTG